METEETPPSESNDQEFNEDVLKQDSEQDSESADIKARKLNKVTPEMVGKLSESLKNDWKKLATKFGYTNEEVYKRLIFYYNMI